MLAKRSFRAPPLLFVLAVLFFLGLPLGWEASITEDLPVFFPVVHEFSYVEITGDGLVSGVYQFYDGMVPRDVIKLTIDVLPPPLLPEDPVWIQPLQNGESLALLKNEREIVILQRGWMAASHRMAMAIPLHPDRMTRSDWSALPGISDVLAERIEGDRQKNGDFGSVEVLIRVKGIGKKRVAGWKVFFEDV